MEEAPDPEDIEAQRQDEEYIVSLVADCPAFPPDPRQSHFFQHLDEWRKNPELEDPQFIPMNGFRASAVDLGWLKTKGMKIVEEKYEEKGPYGLSHLVGSMLERCVQRLKGVMIGPDLERNTIEVRFETKDDEGYYEYRFAVPLPEIEDDDEDLNEENEST